MAAREPMRGSGKWLRQGSAIVPDQRSRAGWWVQAMRRVTLLFMAGILSTALLLSAVSVYVFHDVDAAEIGHWNRAFSEVCFEGLVFTLIIGAAVGLLLWLGQRMFHLRGYPPGTALGVLLGVGVAAFQ